MRIEEFHIDGFGRFENLHMTGIGPGLSIILGRNEAGKSTLLAFLRAVLFGLPSRKQADHFPPFNGGRHGGRIMLRDGDEERIVIERYAGKGSGRFTATLQNGSQLGEEQLRQRLGMVTSDVYEKVFAFGLGELQTFEALQGENIRDAIYSAGMGMGGQSPAQAGRRLNDRCEQLFKPGGSNPAMNQILNRLLERRTEIDRHAIDIDEYQRLQKELKLSNTERDEFGEELRSSRQRLARLNSLQQARNDWIIVTDIRQQLQSLPPIESFPQDAMIRLEALLNDQRSIKDRLLEKREEKHGAEAELAEVQVEESVLAVSSAIRGLERKVELFEQNRLQLPPMQMELSVAQQQLEQSLQDLGSEWNREKLCSFDLSIPVRVELDAAWRSYEEVSRRVDKHAREVELREGEWREQTQSEQVERDALAQLAGHAGDLDVEGIRRLERCLTTYEAARRDLPRVRQECEGNEQRLHAALRSINPDCTEERIDQFDDSLSAREELNVHRERLLALPNQLSSLRARLAEAVQTFREERTVLNSDQARLDTMPTVDASEEAALLDRKGRVRGLRSLIAQHSQAQSELLHQNDRRQDLEAQLSRLEQEARHGGAELPAWLAPTVIAIGLVGLLLLGLARNDWVLGSIVLLIAGALAGLLFVIRQRNASGSSQGIDQQARQRQQIRDRISGIDAILQDQGPKEQEMRQRIIQQAADLGPESASPGNACGGVPGIAIVDEYEVQIEKRLAVLAQRRPIEQRINDRKRQLQRTHSIHQETKKSLSALETQQHDALAAWQDWLRKAGLPVTLSPEVASDVLGRLGSVRELLRAVTDQRKRICEMQREIDHFEEWVTAVAANSEMVDLPADPIAGVQLLIDRLDEQEECQRRKEEARRRVSDAAERTGLAAERLGDAQQSLQSERDTQLRLKKQWTELLNSRGLRETLTGPHVELMLQEIERGRDRLTQFNKLQATERDVADQVSAFLDEYKNVLENVECLEVGSENETAQPVTSSHPPLSAGTVTSHIQALFSRLCKAEEAQRRRNLLGERVQSAEEELRKFQTQIEERQQELDRLFEAAATTDEESFRQRACDYEKYQRLSEERRSCETHLRQLAGSAEALPVLEQELEHSTPEEIQAEQQELDEKIGDLELQRDASVRQSEKLRIDLERLETSDHISVLRMEQESDVSEFRTCAREWMVHRIAAHLIERARQKYERERRPAVVKQAERFFGRLTQGEYQEILIAGEGYPQVVTPEGTRKELDHLSRGTAEQLYLSLRFGFVEEFAQRAHPLPLIFDDILVNFDPERAAAAAAAIGELAQDQQILFFTCHPTTAQLLKDCDASAKIFELQNGRLNGATASPC